MADQQIVMPSASHHASGELHSCLIVLYLVKLERSRAQKTRKEAQQENIELSNCQARAAHAELPGSNDLSRQLMQFH